MSDISITVDGSHADANVIISSNSANIQENTPGLPGPAGPPGLPGAAGAAGPPGADAVVTYQQLLNGPSDVSASGQEAYITKVNDPKAPVILDIISRQGATVIDPSFSNDISGLINLDKILYYGKGKVDNSAQINSHDHTYINIVFRNYNDFSYCVHDASYGTELKRLFSDISYVKELCNAPADAYADLSNSNVSLKHINSYPSGPFLDSEGKNGNRYAGIFSSILVNKDERRDCSLAGPLSSDVSSNYVYFKDNLTPWGSVFYQPDHMNFGFGMPERTGIASFETPTISKTKWSRNLGKDFENSFTVKNYEPSSTTFGNSDATGDLVVNGLDDPNNMPIQVTCLFNLSSVAANPNISGLYNQSKDLWKYTNSIGELIGIDYITLSGEQSVNYNSNLEFLVHMAPNFATILYTFFSGSFNISKSADKPRTFFPGVFNSIKYSNTRITVWVTKEQKIFLEQFTNNLPEFNGLSTDDFTYEYPIVDTVLFNKKIAKRPA